MKPTGFFEILVIVVTLVAGLPLFVACVIMGQNDLGLTYISDKSTWTLEPDYVLVKQDTNGDGIVDKQYLMPEGFTPLNISIAQAAAMMYVQDEYGVQSARKVYYKWDEDNYEHGLVDYTQTSNPDRADFNWTVPYKQRATNLTAMGAVDVVAHVAHKDSVLSKINTEYYMIWNSEIDDWVVTGVPINTIGIER